MSNGPDFDEEIVDLGDVIIELYMYSVGFREERNLKLLDRRERATLPDPDLYNEFFSKASTSVVGDFSPRYYARARRIALLERDLPTTAEDSRYWKP